MAKTIVLWGVIALVPVVYDNVRYEPGEELEIKETELPQLLEVKAVKLKEEALADETAATDAAAVAAVTRAVTKPAAKK